MFLMIKGAWNYRHFITSSIRAEIGGRYSRSRLGGIWLFLHPLAQALVLALVLSQLIGARLSGIDSDYAYAIYLLAGTLAWNYFAETTVSTISMFKERANLLKKINFPRVCIPIIVVGTTFLNHLILSVIIIAIVWALGVEPTSSLLLLPMLMILLTGFALGIGLILSVFDVFVRDVSHLWQVILQFWFWFTPIVYAVDILPDSIAKAMEYNPMYAIVNGYQDAIAYGNVPDFQPFVMLACITICLLFLGFFLFIKASSDIVDAL